MEGGPPPGSPSPTLSLSLSVALPGRSSTYSLALSLVCRAGYHGGPLLAFYLPWPLAAGSPCPPSWASAEEVPCPLSRQATAKEGLRHLTFPLFPLCVSRRRQAMASFSLHHSLVGGGAFKEVDPYSLLSLPSLLKATHTPLSAFLCRLGRKAKKKKKFTLRSLGGFSRQVPRASHTLSLALSLVCTASP